MKFKHEKDMLSFASLHPILIMIYADLYWYTFINHNVELTVTDTISTLKEDQKLGRVSSSHRKALAIDFRTKDLDAFVLDDIVSYINNKEEYRNHHYLSKSGVYRLAYVHNNSNGEHCHLAIHSRYSN
jgi:hypothetical protein